MAEATLSLAAKVHAALARALDWVWPRGAAWAYADAIAHAPSDPELRFLRGSALGRARRWADAARSLSDAAALRPSSAEYQGALVVALGRAGRERELVEALRRFAELRPGEGEVQVLLGTVLRRCGRMAEALRAFRLAVRLGVAAGHPALHARGDAPRARRAGRRRSPHGARPARSGTASGSVILRNAGRRSALNFHPGQPMDRVPRRQAPSPRRAAARRGSRSASRGPAGERAPPAAPGLAPARGAPTGCGPSGRPGARRTGRRRGSARARRRPRRRAARAREARRRSSPRSLLAAGLAAAAERETAAAREQARLCERKNLEEGAAACRAALALGIGPERRGPIREILARHLVAPREVGRARRAAARGRPSRPDERRRLAAPRADAALRPRRAGRGHERPRGGRAPGAPGRAGPRGPRSRRCRRRVARRRRRRPSRRPCDRSLRFSTAGPAARAALEAAGRGEPWP